MSKPTKPYKFAVCEEISGGYFITVAGETVSKDEAKRIANHCNLISLGLDVQADALSNAAAREEEFAKVKAERDRLMAAVDYSTRVLRSYGSLEIYATEVERIATTALSAKGDSCK